MQENTSRCFFLNITIITSRSNSGVKWYHPTNGPRHIKLRRQLIGSTSVIRQLVQGKYGSFGKEDKGLSGSAISKPIDSYRPTTTWSSATVSDGVLNKGNGITSRATFGCITYRYVRWMIS